MEGNGNNVQDLVDCFDSIPEMMSKIKSSEQNRSRFQILEPNHSYNVAYALRGNRSVDSSHPSNANQVNRMAQQAKKVLDHLNQIPRTKAAGKDVETCAHLAEAKLGQLRDNGVDLTKFYQQYDVHRNGKVSYKDFSDTLLSLSTGIGRDDAMLLASRLDKHKAGFIDYKNIFSALRQVQSAPKKSSAAASGPAAVAFGTCKSSSNHLPTERSAHLIDQVAGPSQPSPLLSASTSSSSGLLDPVYAHSHYIPKSLVTLEALSPNVYDRKAENIFEAGDSNPLSPSGSTNGKIERASRRFYHDRPNTAVTAKLKMRIPPFYVDPSPDERRGRGRAGGGQRGGAQNHRRAHSEPPTAVRSLTQHISRPGFASSSAATGESSGTSKGQRSSPSKRPAADKSLRSSLRQPSTSTSATSSSMLSSEHAQIVAPLTQLLQASQRKHHETEALQLKQTENSLLQQVRGNLTMLRHILQQHDPSHSGMLTGPEVQSALRQAGVDLPPTCVHALVERHAAPVVPIQMLQDGGLSRGKGLSIDRLVDSLQTRSLAPAFHHVLGDQAPSPQSRKEAIKVRILKKIAHGMNKHSNPQKLFQDIRENKASSSSSSRAEGGGGSGQSSAAWTQQVSTKEFQEALQYAGVQLSETEMNFLVREMDVRPTSERGSGGGGGNSSSAGGEAVISLPAWDRLLHSAIQSYDQHNHKQWKQLLQESRHYSRSYQSCDLFTTAGVPEFHRLDETQQSRKDKKQWDKLREHIQVQHGKVLRAFSSSSKDSAEDRVEGETSPPSLAVSTLCKNLQREGVLLGRDDLSLLQEKVQQQAGEMGCVDMEGFCSIMGIPLKLRHGSNTFETLDPTEVMHEEGVFASSRRSISANPRYSTSVFLQTDEQVRRLDFGERKRRAGHGLVSPYGTDDFNPFAAGERGRVSQASKFWELERSVDNPMLFPCPRTEVHPSFSNSLDVSALRKGVVKLKDSAAAGKLSARSLSRWQQTQSERWASRDDASMTSTTNASRQQEGEWSRASTRAHSAPPASRSLAVYHDSRLALQKQQARGAADGVTASSISPVPTSSHSGTRSQAGGSADKNWSNKLSKWSSDTLTNYFAQKEGGSVLPTTRLQRSDSRESTVSPSSYHSASTNSMGTTDRLGGGTRSSTRFFSNADKGRGALRKQYDQRAAPFATDHQ